VRLNQKYINEIVTRALKEDLYPRGDITSNLLNNNLKITAKIICNQNAIIAGIKFAKTAFKLIDKKTSFKTKTKDGTKIKKGKIIALIIGKAKSIFKAERVALNFLGLTSGVATKTSSYVTAVKGRKCKICCTRKTLPNLRLLQKYAVKLGGGLNHRFNLSDEYLIKDNHIASSNNVRKIILKAIKNKNKKITVEVDKISQLKTVMGLKFHRILFDNMNAKKLRLGVKLAKKYYETEASGGVTHKNIKKIASTGVSRISVGEITHSAPTIDLKLQI
jgi:nicotinate-nucleotide pyrophosphorylase (carboxylating)